MMIETMNRIEDFLLKCKSESTKLTYGSHVDILPQYLTEHIYVLLFLLYSFPHLLLDIIKNIVFGIGKFGTC